MGESVIFWKNKIPETLSIHPSIHSLPLITFRVTKGGRKPEYWREQIYSFFGAQCKIVLGLVIWTSVLEYPWDKFILLAHNGGQPWSDQVKQPKVKRKCSYFDYDLISPIDLQFSHWSHYVLEDDGTPLSFNNVLSYF